MELSALLGNDDQETDRPTYRLTDLQWDMKIHRVVKLPIMIKVRRVDREGKYSNSKKILKKRSMQNPKLY